MRWLEQAIAGLSSATTGASCSGTRNKTGTAPAPPGQEQRPSGLPRALFACLVPFRIEGEFPQGLLDGFTRNGIGGWA